MKLSRRLLLVTAATTGVGLVVGAQAQAKVDEKDPQAMALGYVDDANRADVKKFPKFAAGQVCSNCSLYQGKPGDSTGGCALFAGKQVSAKGWCSAWTKKA